MDHLNKDIACHLIAEPYLTDRDVRNWITSHISQLKSFLIKQVVKFNWFGQKSGRHVIGQPQFIRIRDFDLVQPIQLPASVRHIEVPWNVKDLQGTSVMLSDESMNILMNAIKLARNMSTFILRSSNLSDVGAIRLAECIQLSKYDLS